MDITEIKKFYDTSLSKFTNEIERAISMSKVSTGLKAGDKRYWASVLFTRLCTSSVSLLSLCPGSKVNPNGIHWDFSSIASLTRNLFENSLTFFYIAIDEISEDEWFARLKVMQIHDCLSRLRMFRDFDSNDSQLNGFETQADELRLTLSNNKYFQSLSEKQRKKILKGEQSCILTQDEVLERMREKDSQTRGYYRFLSSHIHSFPLAFYRMGENNLGRGVESDIEIGYAAGAIDFASEILKRTNDDMGKYFSDIVKNPNVAFDRDILKKLINVTF